MRSLQPYCDLSEANHICPAPTGRGNQSHAPDSLVRAFRGDCRADEPPAWQPHYLRLLGGHYGSAWTNAGPVAHVEWWQGLGTQGGVVHKAHGGCASDSCRYRRPVGSGPGSHLGGYRSTNALVNTDWSQLSDAVALSVALPVARQFLHLSN